MFCELPSVAQTTTAPLSFFWETFSIFLGDVLAVLFGSFVTFVLWYLLKYPGFQVGAGWTYVGWDAAKMGRLPNESDTGRMVLFANVSVISKDANVRKVISAVWVRERPDISDPGEILGHVDLQRTMPAEIRTTGGDLVKLVGPQIECDAKDFKRISSFPIFIQTSDGEFYQASSPGNQPKGIAKLRVRFQRFVFEAKQRLQRRLG
jgi:hypothetical protein